jgi:hypothetical protein
VHASPRRPMTLPASARRTLALIFAGALLLLIIVVSRGAAADPPVDPLAGLPDQATLLPASEPGVAPAEPTPAPTADPAADPLEAAPPEAALLTELGPNYLSPVTAAARPFTNMLLRWEAAVPPGAAVQLEVRASFDGQSWSEWGLVEVDSDLWVPEDGPEVYWSHDIYAGEGARFWQVRAFFYPSGDGALPELRRVDVNTVDARFGPPEPQPDSFEPGMAGLLSRPAVVSRSAWGSPDGQGSRATPAYRAVTHMVVHHTADSNTLASGQRWADRVRAIWSFHTITRGWGDIGYNFLIDPNGVIYEGRAGGDNAVGFHDTANYGSMGVSLIGTYSATAPTESALGSLVELLSWKAEQRDIDPRGRSFYHGCSISQYCNPYNSGAIVSTIAGHRDVTPGRTTCPGDALESLLPMVRDRVAERLGGGAGGPIDNGDLTIDEREAGFERSPAQWYELSCGLDNNSYYTYATDNAAESTNRAVWRPSLPEAGRYEVLVHIPQGCNLGQATSSARYRVTTASGVHEKIVDQSASGGWLSLGSFDFAAGNQGAVELSDLTGEALSSGRIVYFDSVRWVKEDPAAAKLDVLGVSYDRTSVAAGELLKVTFTVKNSGPIALEGQAPEAGSGYSPADSYVYDEGECFLGAEGQSYPAYPKEMGRVRVMLGPADPSRMPACVGDSGGYPWRWGINGRLAPGEVREVVGYLRLRTPGVLSLHAGAINEYVGYLAQGASTGTITVTPERQIPAPAAYDELLRPLAHVYRAELPDNFLARGRDAGAALRGAYAGSFPWQGETLAWGEGGPLAQAPELRDRFIVEQTRAFVAPVSGLYSFRVTAADGGWLWVNGQLVAGGAGGEDGAALTGSVSLGAGRHVLSFKGLERGGAATMGYAVQGPGEAAFLPPREGLAGEERLGAAFRQLGGLTVVADDIGGSGVARLRLSVDGGPWQEQPGWVANIGPLGDGWHNVRYAAVDNAGNQSEERSLSFRVDPALVIYRTYAPLAVR